MNTYEGLEDRWSYTSTIRERDYLLILESKFDTRRAMGCCQVTGFLKDGPRYRRFDESHVERGYHAHEIEAELERAGLSYRKLDGETLGRVRKRSPRLLYLCQHPRARKHPR